MRQNIEKNEFNIVLFEWRFLESLYKFTLGIHYLTSVLRKENYTVSDLIFENESVDAVYEQVMELNPSVIGIQFYRETEAIIFEFVRKVKQSNPNIIIILGGHTATLYAAYILNKEPSVDVIVYGEGELTIVDLCNRLKNNNNLDGCKGIFYKQGDVIIRNSYREMIEDLDSLPYPALDVLKTKHIKSKAIYTGVSTSRGCLGKCGFCVSNRIFNEKKKEWRGRSPENIVGEIEYLQKEFADKRIVYRIVDGSFEDPDPINKERVKNIVELYEKRSIKTSFEILTRAESWKEEDEPLIRRLRKIGLFQAAIGFEASNPRLLKLLNKRACIEDNYRAYKLFTRNDVNVFGFLIMFHPYVLFEELKNNADFILKMDMGYQPQNWWSELFLWPDSRILSHIVKDGLLIGTEPQGYQLLYAFEDGRVAQVYKTLNNLKNLQVSHKYRESIEKVKQECLLYGVWKDQYEEMSKIKDEMEEYQQIYKETRKEMGQKQYGLFIAILEAVEKGTLFSEVNLIMNDWEKILVEKHKYIENQWMIYRMRFGRKKVILI